MIIDKIQHHLGFSFLVLLIIAQSIFFLGARASIDAMDDLQALFVSPSVNANIERGQFVDFVADLYVPEQDNLSGAYFSISNLDLGIDANFTAYKNEAGYWQSNLKWDTNAWPAGQYYINASAYVYNENGIVISSYESIAKTVNLIEPVEYEAAQVMPPDGGALNSAGLLEIITPTNIDVVDTQTPLQVEIRTSEVSTVGRYIRLGITVPGSIDVLKDGRILECAGDESTNSCIWTAEMDIFTNLEPGAQYQLTAKLLLDDPNIGEPSPDVGDSVIFQTVQATNTDMSFSVLSWDPEPGITIWGEHNITLNFEPAIPDNNTIVAKVGNASGASFPDLQPVIISNDRKSLSVVWDTASTTGDFADPVYPDNDLSNQNDYYKIYFYRVVDGVQQDLEGLLVYYTVDNYTNIRQVDEAGNDLVGLESASQVANLFFKFDDPLSNFDSLSARVYDVFGNPYLPNTEEYNDHTLQVNWNTLTFNDNEELRFPNSTNNADLYDLQIIGTGGTYQNSVIKTFNYLVQNGDEQDLAQDFSVWWHEPVDEVYRNQRVYLQAQTSLPASEVVFEIRHATDTTIGSGILNATAFNISSTLWVDTYIVPSDWPDGNYIIEMRAIPEGGTEADQVEAEHGPIRINSIDQPVEQVSFNGMISFPNWGNFTGIETVAINPSTWSEYTIRNADFVFIVNNLSGDEIYRIEDKGIFKDYENKKISANLDTTKIENGTYKLCAIASYESQSREVCANINIYNPDTDGIPDDILGTLEGEFLELERDQDTNALYFRFKTSDTYDSASFIVKHVESEKVIESGFYAQKSSGMDYYESAMRMPQSASWAGYSTYPPGTYVYYFRAIKDGQELWSNKSSYPFVIPPKESFEDQENQNTDEANTNEEQGTEPEIKIHLVDSLLETGDFIVISTNFYKEGITPTVGFKFGRTQGRGSYEVKVLKNKQCDDGTIPKIIRDSIKNVAHNYCWVARVPKEQGELDPNNENRVNDDSNSLLVDGPGSIMASYSDGEKEYIRVANNSVEFAFSNRDVSDYESSGADQEDDLTEEQKRNKLATSFYGEVDCLDYGIYDDNICLQFQALTGNQIEPQCFQAGIYSEDECENYLLQKRVKLECDKQEIVDPVECQDFLLEKYFSTVECKLDSIDVCTQVLREKYLNRLVVARDKQEKISSSTDSIIGQILPLDELSTKLEESEVEDAVLPLHATNETKVLLARSTGQTVLETEKQLTILHTAVMIIDSDGDGLFDDLESYYGTDKDNPDSDGDGYSDGEEVRNGYNPMGEGKIDKEKSDLQKIIEASKNIEQPKKFSEKIDKNIKLELSKTEENKIRFSGIADANTWVNIFVYSDLPLVLTTKTDESGNWTYDLQKSLVDGGHNVYVTVNDDTGSIVKQSGPLAFLVKSAQAVTADQYFDAGQTTVDSVAGSMLWLYIVGALLILIFGILFIVYLYRSKSSQV